MSTSPARFTFDLDLTRNQDNASFMSDTARAALRKEAHAEGYAQGLAAGERNATSTSAQALAAAADLIAERASTLLSGLDAARGAAERDALGIAAGIGRKLATALMAQQPAAELEALLADCLTSLAGVPHLVIRCHPDLADKVRDLANARIATSGFTGRLIVMGDPDQKLGDGRIEWADGGLVRDIAAIAADIDGKIAAYLAARGLSPLEENQQ
jgi:flagellar assembly protein FliH